MNRKEQYKQEIEQTTNDYDDLSLTEVVGVLETIKQKLIHDHYKNQEKKHEEEDEDDEEYDDEDDEYE